MRRRLIGLLVAACALVAPSACTSSGPGAVGTTEAAVAKWPDSVDSLDLVRGAPAFVDAVHAAASGAADVQVRRLTGHGGVVQRATGTSTAADVPDVVFLSRAGGYTEADLAGLHTATLGAVLGAVPHASPGSSGALGGALFPAGVGFTGGTVGDAGAPGGTATWCAFTSHGVAVIVLASTLTSDQDLQLARAMQA